MTRHLLPLTAAATLLTLAAGAGHAAVRTQLPTGVEPTAYDLTLTPDAKALTFKGQVAITLEAAAPTPTITLNAADLVIAKATLDGAPATATLDAAAETATFTAKAPLTAGRHVLMIDYTGKVADRPSGLFHVDYDAKARRDGRALLTQFEPADARRFLPCFDEPSKKAVFTVTAIAPTGLTAIANMPAASTDSLPGGLTRTHFAPTPKMSTYLLFFGLGDFERITGNVDGTEVGILIKRGDTEKGRFALDAATRLLAYYNGYFGVKYPLPKLDLIAAPGESAGAMENWGAILYTQSALVIDPKTANERERQQVFGVIAHEMAHQWFGDLVTMGWWDDLWLNEGFASWMATKASDHFHPEWKPLLDALGSKDAAMRLDAKRATHPIVQEVATVAQAEQAFDAITYEKGEAVIRMLEAYAGEDAWRAGVRRYMAAHAYGNTQSADLWREIDAAAGKPVSAVAYDFTTQPGVPLLSIDGEPGRLRVAQGRFGVDAPSKTALTWKVPVGTTGAETLVSGLQPQPLPPGALIANAGQTAYARSLYAPKAFAELTGRYATLPAADQIGSLNDSVALGLAGYAPIGGALDLLVRLPTAADPVAWRLAAERLVGLDGIYVEGLNRVAFRAWAAARLRPVMAELAWDAKPGEGSNAGVLRERLIGALSDFDDAATISEARRRFVHPEALPPGLRSPVLTVVAVHADAATFDRLLAAARASTDPLEKAHIYQALGQVRDPALAQRVLDIALSPEAPSNTGVRLIGEVSGEHPDLVWRFVLAHTGEIAKGADALVRNQLVPGVASSSRELKRADELEAYAKANIPPDAQGSVRVALAQIRYNAEITAKRAPEIDAWLAAHR